MVLGFVFQRVSHGDIEYDRTLFMSRSNLRRLRKTQDAQTASVQESKQTGKSKIGLCVQANALIDSRLCVRDCRDNP